MTALTGWRKSRGSSSIGASGLFVLALGALVLLSGLSKPAPQPQDLIAVAISPLPASPGVVPQWLGGLGMVAVALLGLGARRRAQRLFPYASAGAAGA
jgi:hypothetical protein